MWPHEEASLAKVEAALEKHQIKNEDASDASSLLSCVCRRCVLRLAGVKNSREHHRAGERSRSKEEQPANTEGADVETEPSAKRPKLSAPWALAAPCLACLGLLQEEHMTVALEKVSRDIRDCHYDADHFTVALSFPVSLALRSKSIALYLQDEIDTFDEDDVVPIKQVWKWIFSQRLEKLIDKKYVTGDFCQFYVELQIDFDEEEEEQKCLRAMCEEEYSMREKKQKVYHMGVVTRQGADKSLAEVSDKKFRQHYPVPPTKPGSGFKPSVTMNHLSIHLAGRYNKYSRSLPQTPWFVDGQRHLDTSVEELIVDEIKSFSTFDAAKFSSSGREDVDVRMLGRGRPFLFEVTNPRKTRFEASELAELQKRINAGACGQRVRVRDLQVVSKSEIKHLKEGEDQKRKVYTALCVLSKPLAADQADMLNSLKDLELSQKTPIRVLHRRPNAVRKRTVYYMKATPLTDCLFKLELATQAGTYIKEFVHGDFQRTRPNLRELLQCEADIVALDVESIVIDWPPSLEAGKEEEAKEEEKEKEASENKQKTANGNA